MELTHLLFPLALCTWYQIIVQPNKAQPLADSTPTLGLLKEGKGNVIPH